MIELSRKSEGFSPNGGGELDVLFSLLDTPSSG